MIVALSGEESQISHDRSFLFNHHRAKIDKDKKTTTIATATATASTIKSLIHKAKEIFSPEKQKKAEWQVRDKSENDSAASLTGKSLSTSSASSSSTCSAVTNAAVVAAAASVKPPPAPPPGSRPSTFDKLMKLKKAEHMRRDKDKIETTATSSKLPVAASSAAASIMNKKSSSQEEQQARKGMVRDQEVHQKQKAHALIPAAANNAIGSSSSSSSYSRGKPLEEQVREKLKQMKEKRVDQSGGVGNSSSSSSSNAPTSAASSKAFHDKMHPTTATTSAASTTTSASAATSVTDQQQQKDAKKMAMLKKIREDALRQRAPALASGQQQSKQPSHAKAQQSRPEDTYEISDREGSDDESDSDEESAPRKRVPDWARSKELIPALQAQFCDASNRIDPDTIFPEVQSCDLEDIFDQKKSRYSRRTSSGEWTKDQITQGEKITYRKEMGFTGA